MAETKMTERSPEHPAGTAPALEVRDIHRSLPLGHERIDILHGISFRIQRGEFVAIIGPSGSGKSTLLGIIAGLDNPTSGQVFVDGVEITKMGEGELALIRNQKIGVVFQSFNLIPTLTARENVEIPLYVGKHSGSPSERSKQMLDLVGLGHRLNHKPGEMSGGEQQRVAIARALGTDPAIVIMDEPTGNLDGKNSKNVLELIHDLQTGTGTTFVIATHDPSVATSAQRVIRIDDGKVVGDGTPAEVGITELEAEQRAEAAQGGRR
ncbi:MAG: ABC transporter ATP-binding protein [Dehalococcoidia bacterium]